MTTAKPPKIQSSLRLPDPPEKHPDDMTSAKHLAEKGNMYLLIEHLGNPETTIVKSELYLALGLRGQSGYRVPDLLVAFDVDPELYEMNNGYAISEQRKPPDFVLEIASPSTRKEDNDAKRGYYARHGVREYWRFDEKDTPGSVRLAGDRLVDGGYEPLPIEELPDGGLQGHSEALNLLLRWERGELRFYDPATEAPILTMQDERARADREREARLLEQARADRERQERLQAEAQARQQEEARLLAEARVRELEARLENLENQ